MKIILYCLLLAVSIASLAKCGVTPNTATQGTQGPPVLVIGFVGGFVSHENLAHSGVLLATRIRHDYPRGVYAEVFENRRSEDAHKQILRLLDTNHDGKLSEGEKQRARIVIYGHSWGGSETVALAKALQRDHIPVLLTIQVDSVAKIGEDDLVIPPNVVEAVNYYQTDGILHGCPQIRAEDPTRTRIMGNFRFQYHAHPIQCEGLPWYSHIFTRPHIEIECDPTVLGQVDSLIRSKLPRLSAASIH